MKREKFPWKREYQFVEPGINSGGVCMYPFDPVFPVGVSFLTTSGHRLDRMNRHEFLEVLYISRGDLPQLFEQLPDCQGSANALRKGCIHR